MILAVATVLAYIAGTATGFLLADRLRRRTPERTQAMPNRPVTRKSAFIVVVVLVLGLIITGVGAGVSWHRAAEASNEARAATADVSEHAACLGRYQQRFGQIYEQRIKPTRKVFDALDRVMFAVIGRDSDDFSQALKDYIAVREDQKQALAENPPPPLPKKVCGVPPEVE